MRVEVAEEIRSLEPPVAEQLRVKGSDNDRSTFFDLRHGDAIEKPREVARVCGGLLTCCVGFVRRLAPQVGARLTHAPEFQPTGPANLVKLEVRCGAGITAVPAPHLRRRAWIAN